MHTPAHLVAVLDSADITINIHGVQDDLVVSLGDGEGSKSWDQGYGYGVRRGGGQGIEVKKIVELTFDGSRLAGRLTSHGNPVDDNQEETEDIGASALRLSEVKESFGG